MTVHIELFCKHSKIRIMCVQSNENIFLHCEFRLRFMAILSQSVTGCCKYYVYERSWKYIYDSQSVISPHPIDFSLNIDGYCTKVLQSLTSEVRIDFVHYSSDSAPSFTNLLTTVSLFRFRVHFIHYRKSL